MKVVVTGGAGFIGSHVVESLLRDGHDVSVVDDLSTGQLSNLPPGVPLVRLDISGRRAADVVRGLRPDAVVHGAAQASVAGSARDPVRDAMVNIIGSLNVASGAIAAGAHRFLYLNTGGALYGNARRWPTPESAAVRPLSPYGLSKWSVEAYLRLLAPRPRWWTSLRLANVYGPRQRPDGEAGVVSVFCDRMLSGLPVDIHGDGEQTRDFVYVGDVADAVSKALVAPRTAVVNIGTGTGTSINVLYEAIARQARVRGKTVHTLARQGDVRRSILDPGRASQTIGWIPTTTLDRGLEQTVEWHRARGTRSDPA